MNDNKQITCTQQINMQWTWTTANLQWAKQAYNEQFQSAMKSNKPTMNIISLKWLNEQQQIYIDLLQSNNWKNSINQIVEEQQQTYNKHQQTYSE